MVQNNIQVSTFIIVLLIALAQLSETIYTPSLPDMAKDLGVLESYTEYTLTTYLIGFAVGVLIWGTFSDYYGRKKGIVLGLVIYIISSFACWFTKDITSLYILRFVQAFGASVGSVLGQAVARDAVLPEERGKVYSIISMAMAFAPAIGPFLGSLAVARFNWSSVFLLLVALGSLILVIVTFKLPETNKNMGQQKFSLELYKECILAMFTNKRLWGFSIIIGIINGIIFGYFAESPFYFIELLGLSKSTFGAMSMYICVPIFIGGWISKTLNQKKLAQDNIILYGSLLICFAGFIFVAAAKSELISSISQAFSVAFAFFLISLVMIGNSMIIPNCFSQALEPFGKFSGTAASLFGFVYYIFISGLTGIIGYMHDGTLMPLPKFILLSGLLMLTSHRLLIARKI